MKLILSDRPLPLELSGHPDVVCVDLTRLKIANCVGCFSCWTKTPGRCVHPDDMNGALLKYVEADALIFSFPLYYFSLPSRLKLFLDRTLPLSLPVMTPDSPWGGHPLRDERLLRKRMALISTCGFYTAEGNYDAVTACGARATTPRCSAGRASCSAATRPTRSCSTWFRSA